LVEPVTSAVLPESEMFMAESFAKKRCLLDAIQPRRSQWAWFRWHQSHECLRDLRVRG
jgi:hypothetical protein